MSGIRSEKLSDLMVSPGGANSLSTFLLEYKLLCSHIKEGGGGFFFNCNLMKDPLKALTLSLIRLWPKSPHVSKQLLITSRVCESLHARVCRNVRLNSTSGVETLSTYQLISRWKCLTHGEVRLSTFPCLLITQGPLSSMSS